MRIKPGQDMVTGALFILVGIGALIIGKDYPMGQWSQPGTGVLPALLCGCLIIVGGLLAAKSLLSGDSEVTGIAWRPLITTTIGVVLFALLVDYAGFVLTAVLAMSICALGVAETRWREFAVFLAILILLSWIVFICVLGMPINTCPGSLRCEFCWIVKGPIEIVVNVVKWMVR
jgi:hypothetical protein